MVAIIQQLDESYPVKILREVLVSSTVKQDRAGEAKLFPVMAEQTYASNS